jgi:hypothetical protein
MLWRFQEKRISFKMVSSYFENTNSMKIIEDIPCENAAAHTKNNSSSELI